MPQIHGIDVTTQQEEIYNLLARFPTGLTDHALVSVAQHEMKEAYSDSGIRTRRNELELKGLVRTGGFVRTRRGRLAARFVAQV